MYDYKNKQLNMRRELDFLLAKTLSMFQYEGLPESMPKRDFERQLQTKGYAFVTEFEGELYSFTDGLGGEPDPYGNPTQIVIANPALDFYKTLDLKEDGVLVRNDSMQNGIRNLLRKYVHLMNESEITMLINSFTARMPTLISAGDDATRESAEEYLRQVINGELGVIGENRIFEGINAQTTGGGGSMFTQLIEYHQYLKASLYNELGLEMNHNMKRERLTEDEVNMVDTIYPFVDNMMMNRLEGIEAINKKYGKNIKIAYDSVWGKHEGFDEEQFYSEVTAYLGAGQEEANVGELEALLAELEAIASEEETDGDWTDGDSTDDADSTSSDSDADEEQSEGSEGGTSPEPSGSDRTDDSESGVDNTGPSDGSDGGDTESDDTDADEQTATDDESSDRESDERDSGESSDDPDAGSSSSDGDDEHSTSTDSDEERSGSGDDTGGTTTESQSGESETEGRGHNVEVNVEVTIEDEILEDVTETMDGQEETQEDNDDVEEDEDES